MAPQATPPRSPHPTPALLCPPPQEEIYKTVQAAHGRTSHGGLLYTVPEEEVAATRTIQAEVAQYGHLNEFVRHKKSRVE
jgi:hypothetical protein